MSFGFDRAKRKRGSDEVSVRESDDEIESIDSKHASGSMRRSDGWCGFRECVREVTVKPANGASFLWPKPNTATIWMYFEQPELY